MLRLAWVLYVRCVPVCTCCSCVRSLSASKHVGRQVGRQVLGCFLPLVRQLAGGMMNRMNKEGMKEGTKGLTTGNAVRSFGWLSVGLVGRCVRACVRACVRVCVRTWAFWQVPRDHLDVAEQAAKRPSGPRHDFDANASGGTASDFGGHRAAFANRATGWWFWCDCTCPVWFCFGVRGVGRRRRIDTSR